MVYRENRAELSVHRQVKLLDPTFMPKVRKIANIAFGEEDRGVVTLRPPLVEEPVIRGAGEPLAKVYDPENLVVRLLWRISAGDDRARGKFYKARTALENGVKEKSTPQKRGFALEFMTLPLRDEIKLSTERFETGPDSSYTLPCTDIVTYQHRLVHPGTLLFCLKPDMTSIGYSTLLAEQDAAERTLERVSSYAFNKTNPQSVLMVPFMRVNTIHTEDQRKDFLDQIMTPNIFPVDIQVGPIEFDD